MSAQYMLVGGLINSEFGRTLPNQRGMQMALPEAGYSVFSRVL